MYSQSDKLNNFLSKFKLLNYYICDHNIIAEWDASFNSNIEKARIHMKEVAILEIKKNKIKSLREYWQSEKIPLKVSFKN